MSCCWEYAKERVEELEQRVNKFLTLLLPLAVGKRVRAFRVLRQPEPNPIYPRAPWWDYDGHHSGIITRSDLYRVWFESYGEELETEWEAITFEDVQ